MLSSGVSHHSYSSPLQRVLVDFGAEHAFNRVHEKIREHYGIEIPNSAPRKVTLHHAAAVSKRQEQQRDKKTNTLKARECVISETDGTMVPIVKMDPTQTDKRKKKAVCYREARLSLAHEKGSISPVFSATFQDVDVVGKHIVHCVRRVGIDKKTYIHCVGDGAAWIAEQVDKQFGKQATYLIDFYHVCEYIAAAAPTCNKTMTTEWVETQKALLKESDVKQVIANLKPHIESKEVDDANAPVRACHRYLSNRLNQLDYKFALDNDLPIGSGEIESAHRYVIQERLKIQGAWWLEETAENMLALRTHRANNDWEDYWDKLAA